MEAQTFSKGNCQLLNKIFATELNRLPGTALPEGLDGHARGHGRGTRRRRSLDLLGEDATRGRHAGLGCRMGGRGRRI